MRISALQVAALLIFTFLNGTAAAQQDRAGTGSKRAPKFTKDGTEGCLVCHSGERMRLIAATAHGNADNPGSPYGQQGCESCHGPGSFHVSRAHGGRGFRHVIKFGAEEDGSERSPASEQTGACLSCHGKTAGQSSAMLWTGSVHDKIGLACSNCHDMHSEKVSVTDREQQAAGCYSCHENQRTKHPQFSDKGIVFDQLKCWTCHDVHQLKIGSAK
jgi:DmsE family decaheme c-type cytochrome